MLCYDVLRYSVKAIEQNYTPQNTHLTEACLHRVMPDSI